MVGLTTAKAIALVTGKPFIAVNHLEAHALTARLTDNLAFPYLLLLVSGGHTQLLAVRGVGDYLKLGGTIDDAVGEAFDKIAKMLGLPYPGGPSVEREAAKGDPERFDFPRPMQGRPNPDFSLSGLKTAVRLVAERIAPLSDRAVADRMHGDLQAAPVDFDGCGLHLLRREQAGAAGRLRLVGVWLHHDCRPAVEHAVIKHLDRARAQEVGVVCLGHGRGFLQHRERH